MVYPFQISIIPCYGPKSTGHPIVYLLKDSLGHIAVFHTWTEFRFPIPGNIGFGRATFPKPVPFPVYSGKWNPSTQTFNYKFPINSPRSIAAGNIALKDGEFNDNGIPCHLDLINKNRLPGIIDLHGIFLFPQWYHLKVKG